MIEKNQAVTGLTAVGCIDTDPLVGAEKLTVSPLV